MPTIRDYKSQCWLLYGPSLLPFFWSGSDLLRDFLLSLVRILWYENIGENATLLACMKSCCLERQVRLLCKYPTQQTWRCIHVYSGGFVTRLFLSPCPGSMVEHSLSLTFYISVLWKDRKYWLAEDLMLWLSCYLFCGGRLLCITW